MDNKDRAVSAVLDARRSDEAMECLRQIEHVNHTYVKDDLMRGVVKTCVHELSTTLIFYRETVRAHEQRIAELEKYQQEVEWRKEQARYHTRLANSAAKWIKKKYYALALNALTPMVTEEKDQDEQKQTEKTG